MPANEKRRYMMSSDLRQYIAEYTVANFWRYPIRCRVTYASALEYCFVNPSMPSGLCFLNSLNRSFSSRRGVRFGFYIITICFIENSISNVNNIDLDQTPRSAVSDPGLHLLPVFYGAPGINGWAVYVDACRDWWRLELDSVDSQADMSLRWSHMF